MDEYKLSPEAIEDLKARGEKWVEGFKKILTGELQWGRSHGWISVSDRLPKDDETVIVYDKEHGVDVAYHDISGIFYQLKVEGDYCDNFSGVTHWQPLPEKPTD